MKIDSPKAILHELERFRQMGSVLFIAAHPDDENTELLGYLARGRNYRSAYLSLTRGDGGQNVLGADLGDKLGVARTQELLAARQIDGAKQFFSRAIDFGFSKNYQETMSVWDRNEVLSDVVRVIREFRPDIVITRFSPTPGGTHGHHTTSTILAMEAFKLAGDPKAFPEQKLEPWQPKRIFWNVSTWQKDKIASANILKINSTGNDPVSGESFHSIASASRAMHKTQGFDTFKLPGGNGEERFESFQLLDGAAATKDIMEDVDTTWKRLPGGEEIDKSVAGIITKFDTRDPAASVPDLLKLRKQLNSMSAKNVIVKEKQEQLDHILLECLGLKTETTILNGDVVPGEPMKLHMSASFHYKTPGDIPVRMTAVRFPELKKEIKHEAQLQLNDAETFESVETLPTSAPLTQPYWLRVEGTPGMFQVDQPELIGTAENAPAFPVEYVFDVDGQKLVIDDEPLQVSTDSVGNKIKRRMEIIPPVSLRAISDVIVMTPGSSRSVEVEIKTYRVNSSGTLRLEAPSGWKVEPAKQSFDLADIGQVSRCTFKVTAPSKAETARLTASAEINGVRYHSQRQEINYPHIPRQLLQPPAVVKAASVDLEKRGTTVGYLPGAGDSLVENLQQIGYAVKVLDDANLDPKELEGLDAIVIGVRAFNVRANIGAAMPKLLAYVENGGTMIVQYNRPDKLKSDKVAPYDLKISADRVTDEKAAINFLAPDSPILNTPNKITSSDFDGWVQERGLYFPSQWDDRFSPILACNDAGEPPSKGVLLVAKYGKGHYIYTGLSFFRQLPAAVPGAYRLFSNMVSIGK
ncbi:MAG: PIG-L family deacetylase [Candidatus Melainabacteria bacterium]|nr:PIG-L family deacetylase [Candidatus Melainabacteria bacterium]